MVVSYFPVKTNLSTLSPFSYVKSTSSPVEKQIPNSRLYSSEHKTPTGVGLYLRYAWGGALCCMVTHSMAVPIDVVKTRLQLYPERYSGMLDGFRQTIKSEGLKGLTTGLGPTAAGYFMQGAFKFGFYELFKATFIQMVEPEKAQKYRTFIFLASAAMAETIADLALCPMEATRIRLVSEGDKFASGLVSGFAKIWKNEGFSGFYKGLGPILFKQVPYTMAKFAVFERTVELIYKLIPYKKEELSTTSQLSISLGSGIISGIASAIVSHPADTVLSVINKTKTEGSIFKAIFKIMGDLGWKRLWLGIGARIVMIASLTAGQFFIYDSIKVMVGLQTTQGVKSAQEETKK